MCAPVRWGSVWPGNYTSKLARDLHYAPERAKTVCTVSAIRNFGGPGDGEIFFELLATHSSLGIPGTRQHDRCYAGSGDAANL